MRTFILMGHNRETGKDDFICDRTVPISEQIAKRKELAQSRVNDAYSDVVLVEVVPAKSRLKLISTAEADAEKQSVADALKAKEAATKAESKEAAPTESTETVPDNNSPKNKRKKL